MDTKQDFLCLWEIIQISMEHPNSIVPNRLSSHVFSNVSKYFMTSFREEHKCHLSQIRGSYMTQFDTQSIRSFFLDNA